jgi:O-antigen/teichoic acid export membrane protein
MSGVGASFDVYDEPRQHRPSSVPRRSLGTVVSGTWGQHRDLLANASSLAAATVLTSVLGFGYWALAARLFSQQAIGYGSAAISAITLLGTIGMLGLGTVLIGELPRRAPGRARSGLIAAALLTSGIGSLVLGLGFSVLAPHINDNFNHMIGASGRAALFAAGVMLSGATMVFDQATIGLMRGGLQLSRNLAFSLAKIVALPVSAMILHDQFGAGITLSWIVGMGLSLVPLAIRMHFAGSSILPTPNWGVLRALGKTAVAHNWLNLAIQVPWLMLPVLVTVVVSPAANAAFYVAWMLTSFLYIVPSHLSTVLFAIAAADPKVVAQKLRFSLRLSLAIGLPGMVVLGVGAHLALSMFGAGYARTATLAMWLLVVGYLPTIPRTHYVAVCRAKGKIPRAAAVLTTTALIKLSAAALGGTVGGLKGLSFALLGATTIEGCVTAPAVLRTAIGRGRHRIESPQGIVVDSTYPLTGE